VASVQVAPGSITPFPGDTVRLTATPKTASGSDVSGKTVTWASSAATVASVSESGLITAAAPGTATVTATVDGKSGTAQVTVLSRVALDVSRLVSKPVGPSGDSLSTTASNGIRYTLVVPEGALRSGTTITLTPLVSLAGLPFSGGLLAGVELKPSGTTFDRPLILRIASAGSVPAGKTLIGFTAPDSGGAVTLLPASLKDGIISVVVPHFSIVGAAPALPSELAAIAPPPDVQGRVNDFADVARILAQGGDLTSALNQLEVVFSRWYARILPLLNSGLSGDPELLGALQEYRFWLDMMAYAGDQLGTSGSLVELPSLASRNLQGQQILYFDLVAAIARANQACLAFRDLNKAELALFWQATAESLGIAVFQTVSTGIAELSRSVVLANLCVRVFVSDSTFPAAPAPNQSSDLKLRFGIQFGSDPNLRNSTFVVRLTFSGTPADGPADFTTDASGTLAVSVVPTGQRPLRIIVYACGARAEGGIYDVCVVFTIDRVFGTTVTGDITVFTPQGLASLSNVSKIIGNLTITGPMTNLEDLASLQEVTGRVTLNLLPELIDLTGLRNLRTLTHLTLNNLAKLPTVDGLDNLRAVPGTLGLGSLPLVRNLQGLAQLLQVGSLAIADLPQLQSLTGLQAGVVGTKGSLSLETLPLLDDISVLSGITQISSALSLRRLPRLASLRGLRNAQLGSNGEVDLWELPLLTTLSDLKPFPATLGGARFVELPLLQDLAPLRTVTTLTFGLTISGGGPANVSDLALLSDVGAQIVIFETRDLTALSLPSLRTARGLGISGNLALQTIALGSAAIGSAATGGTFDLLQNPALQSVTVGAITTTRPGFPNDRVSVLENPALRNLTTGTITSLLLNVGVGNGLTSLNGIAGADLDFFFFSAPLGEAAGLAFANRVGVRKQVCNAGVKCYTGPPWVP
jgi:hypothetical protein